jgi:hypothetical protein
VLFILIMFNRLMMLGLDFFYFIVDVMVFSFFIESSVCIHLLFQLLGVTGFVGGLKFLIERLLMGS